MHFRPLPDLHVLDTVFEADVVNGRLYWNSSARLGWTGREAGYIDSRGYRKVKLADKTYAVQRILYAMCHRVDPAEKEIDHINGVLDDNRIANLRLATRDQNCGNRRSWREGLRGAYPKNGKWMAVIQIENSRQYLGQFDTEEAAHEAFKKASLAHYGELARLD